MAVMVSFITTGYNHQDTINRAINSVRDQHFEDYEHIIIDDTNTKNGMMKTYQEAFSRCAGKYITFCDGDDYWVDKDRMTKQVDYMDKHEDCGLCLTLTYTEIDNKRYNMKVSADYVNKNMSFDSLLKGNAFIYAPSYLIRKSDFDKYINFDEFLKFNMWDYPIVLELIRHARFHCLDFYSAVFVKNVESVTNTRSRRKRAKYVYGIFKIKWHYIKKYGCKFSTKLYLIYKIVRSIYSIGFKRWT
jgi:glycosyltransferase involved in cell wall biosynthesis